MYHSLITTDLNVMHETIYLLSRQHHEWHGCFLRLLAYCLLANNSTHDQEISRASASFLFLMSLDTTALKLITKPKYRLGFSPAPSPPITGNGKKFLRTIMFRAHFTSNSYGFRVNSTVKLIFATSGSRHKPVTKAQLCHKRVTSCRPPIIG